MLKTKKDYLILIILTITIATLAIAQDSINVQLSNVSEMLNGTATPTIVPTPTPLPNRPPLLGDWSCDETDETLIKIRNNENVEVSEAGKKVTEAGYPVLTFTHEWWEITLDCNVDGSVHKITLQTNIIDGQKPPYIVLSPILRALVTTAGIPMQSLPFDGTQIEGTRGWIIGKVDENGGTVIVWGKRGGETKAGLISL